MEIFGLEAHVRDIVMLSIVVFVLSMIPLVAMIILKKKKSAIIYFIADLILFIILWSFIIPIK